MNKKLLILGACVLSFAVIAGVVLAWFSSRAKILGISFSTANADLLVNGQSEWNSNLSFDAIYPSWESEATVFTLQNNSDADLTLQVEATALIDPAASMELADSLEMAIRQVGDSSALSYQSLTWWEQNGDLIHAGLTQGQSQDYEVFFRLSEAAPATVQSDVLNLDIVLTACRYRLFPPSPFVLDGNPD